MRIIVVLVVMRKARKKPTFRWFQIDYLNNFYSENEKNNNDIFKTFLYFFFYAQWILAVFLFNLICQTAHRFYIFGGHLFIRNLSLFLLLVSLICCCVLCDFNLNFFFAVGLRTQFMNI